jgi:hypothetical protein
MLLFFIAFIIVFAIGMGIRYLIKSSKSKNQAPPPPPAAPPPFTTLGTCPQCGKPVQPGAGFCDACGAKLR